MSRCPTCHEPLVWSGDYHHAPECTNPDCRENVAAQNLRWEQEFLARAVNQEAK